MTRISAVAAALLGAISLMASDSYSQYACADFAQSGRPFGPLERVYSAPTRATSSSRCGRTIHRAQFSDFNRMLCYAMLNCLDMNSAPQDALVFYQLERGRITKLDVERGRMQLNASCMSSMLSLLEIPEPPAGGQSNCECSWAQMSTRINLDPGHCHWRVTCSVP